LQLKSDLFSQMSILSSCSLCPGWHCL